MKSILYNFTPQELQRLLDTSESYSDILRKLELNPKGRNPDTLKKVIKEFNLDETQLDVNRKKLLSKCAYKSVDSKTYDLQDILDGKHKKYQSSKLLKRLVNSGLKENKCENCGIVDWMGKEITFQLHHKDGNHQNNSLDNLIILCPNCHSQTDSYCGKSSNLNKERWKQTVRKVKQNVAKLPPIQRDELKNKIRNNSIVSIAKEYGVTDNAIRKWCDKYKLPRQKRIINSYSDEEWELL